MDLVFDKNYIRGEIEIFKTDANNKSVLISKTQNKVYAEMFNHISNTNVMPNFYISFWKDNIDSWDPYMESVESVLNDWPFLTLDDKTKRSGIFPPIASKKDILPIMPKHIFKYGISKYIHLGMIKTDDGLLFSNSYYTDIIDYLKLKNDASLPQNPYVDLTYNDSAGNSYELNRDYIYYNTELTLNYLTTPNWRNMYYAYGDNKYLVQKINSIEQSIKYLPENTVKVIDELTNDEIITIEYSIQIIKKFNKSDFGDKPSDYKYLSLSLDFNSTNNHKQLSIGKKRLKNLINDSELRPDFSYAPAGVTKKFNINGEEKTYSDFYKIGDSKFLERTRPVSIDISNETDIYKTNPFSYTYNLTTANVNEDENGNAVGIELGDEETIDIIYTLNFRVSYPKLRLNFNIKNVDYAATYQIYNPYYITGPDANLNVTYSDLVRHIFNIIPKRTQNNSNVYTLSKFKSSTYYEALNKLNWKLNYNNYLALPSTVDSIKNYDINNIKNTLFYYDNNNYDGYATVNNKHSLYVLKRKVNPDYSINELTYFFSRNRTEANESQQYIDFTQLGRVTYHDTNPDNVANAPDDNPSNYNIKKYINRKYLTIDFPYDDATETYTITNIIYGARSRTWNLATVDENLNFKFNQKLYNNLTYGMPKLTIPKVTTLEARDDSYSSPPRVHPEYSVTNTVNYGIYLRDEIKNNKYYTAAEVTIYDYPIYAWLITIDKPLEKSIDLNISFPIPSIKWSPEDPNNPNIAKLS
jgi:hypothetical protein